MDELVVVMWDCGMHAVSGVVDRLVSGLKEVSLSLFLSVFVVAVQFRTPCMPM